MFYIKNVDFGKIALKKRITSAFRDNPFKQIIFQKYFYLQYHQ